MDTIIFAVNAIMPIILVIAFGYFLKRINIVNGDFVKQSNKFVFTYCLPVMLFLNLYECETIFRINWTIVIYAYVVTIIMYFIGVIAVKLFRIEDNNKGTVIQCCFRTNFAVIGLPLSFSLFGDAGMATTSLLVLSTPLVNILAIIAFNSGKDIAPKERVNTTIKDIFTNPLNIGVFFAIIVLLIRELFVKFNVNFRLTDISFLMTALGYIKNIATPFALLLLGAQFEFASLSENKKSIIVATIFRVVIIPILIIIPTALIFKSFKGGEYAAVVSLVSSPVAVTSALIAGELGGNKELAGQLVISTTLASIITLFFIVIILRSVGIF